MGISKHSEAAHEMMYQQFLRVYKNQCTRKEAAEYLCTRIDGYKMTTFLRYMDSFLHMMDGTKFASVVPSDLAVFLLSRIAQEHGIAALSRALSAEKQHIQYYYDVSGSSQSRLCHCLAALAASNGISMTFAPATH